MAAGEEGVAKAINIYKSELKRTMHLLGVSKISDLSPKYAVLRPQ
jgi:L-lactate dehydrogenase (cytochrome)